MDLSTPISKVSRVGTKHRERLQKLGIRTVGDLLYHFPHRYEDFSRISSVSSLEPYEKNTVLVRVEEISQERTARRNIPLTRAVLRDKTGSVEAIWFKQPYLARSFREGEMLFLSGKVERYKGNPVFISPSYEKVRGRRIAPTHTARIIPVYPETEGLSSRFLRSIIKPILKNTELVAVETLPEEIIREKELMPLAQALREIHFPRSTEKANEAQRRFSFERVFLLQLMLLKKKMSLAREKGVAVRIDLEEVRELIETLPFDLTDAQRKAAWHILKDMEKESPMNRLLEGDVGSGKTIVALIAALATIKAGHQAVFMAPTEVLSRQHFEEAAKLLWRFKVDVGLLTGKKDLIRSKKLKGDVLETSREKLIEKCRKGEMDLLIGTHALIEDKVKFKDLALVILDEQHRFGTKQRSKLCLKEKSRLPNLLSMTATPIPRTLALTLYGELDLSVIDEMPRKRKKVETRIVPPKQREEIYDFIKKEIEEGKQAFFICPRIEEDEKEEMKTVEEEKERLEKEVFPDLSVEALHGKMKGTEKEDIMRRFRAGKIDILVSTSVIEVGIDIPNATVMVIEGAERFGLAQLHQFRGRVGRGESQSYCFLFPGSWSEKTSRRLKALLSSENGFELAERDLELRGPGDFLGKRQWGMPDFTMNALKDRSQVEEAREAAKRILEEDPDLKGYPLLQKRVEAIRKRIHLE